MKKLFTIAAIVFAVLWLHGTFLGLTDDEAYYWALARNPGWGFAFHPPAVVWILSVFNIFGPHASTALVRLPSALGIASIIFLILLLFKERKLLGARDQNASEVTWNLVAFAGFFGVSWMMVPDTSLFLGWTLAFYSCWMWLEKGAGKYLWGLGVGVFICVLSKYSGVLVGLSLLAAVWKSKKRNAAIATIFAAGVFAVVPTVIWNAQHGWQALAYQFSERHGGSISLSRFSRFWMAEVLLAGPALLVFFFICVKKWFSKGFFKKADPFERYVAFWAIPPAFIFCLQPLFSDFKLHWVFIAWFPILILLCENLIGKRKSMTAKWHRRYGLTLLVILLLSCHIPVMQYAHAIFTPTHLPATLDVTNDLYGWNRLPELSGQPNLPVVASRYQTASQAAFALRDLNRTRVTLIPRDLKQRDEWPDLKVTEGWGPAWPRLLKPVFFVADNRYSDGPHFKNATCASLQPLETRRNGYLAKRISIWKCTPKSS
ncbi:glycosyltransferase family 39 protein [bacterium]|jgi:hypothetical protein|nr:glycosyltransferase family 39 protein [bacterium]